MTVKELIEVLKSFPQDLPIVVDADGPEHGMLSILDSERVRFGFAYTEINDGMVCRDCVGEVTRKPEPVEKFYDEKFRYEDDSAGTL